MTVLSYLIADAVVKSQWITTWRYWRLFGSASRILQVMPSWHNCGKGSEVCSSSVHLWTCTRLLFSHCCQQQMWHQSLQTSSLTALCPGIRKKEVIKGPPKRCWCTIFPHYQRSVKMNNSSVLVFTTRHLPSPPTRALSNTIHKVYVGLPTASTCSNVLRIPLHLTEYEWFKASFDLAIRSCQGFGTI